MCNFLEYKGAPRFCSEMALANLSDFRHKGGLPTICISILHRWLLVNG